MQEKASIILKFLEAKKVDDNLSYAVFAEMQNIPDPGMLWKWVDDKETILNKAYEGCTLKKIRSNPNQNPRHANTHKLLYSEFVKKRNIGYKISFLWIWITGRKLAVKHSYPSFTRWGAEQFLVKFNVKIRHVQRKKQKPKSFHVEPLRQWHFGFREDVIRSQGPNMDPKFGRFKLNRRFNVDQVPLPFVIDQKTTYESADVGRYDKVWLSIPGSGLDKRQCTLQVCFSPEDNTCRIAIIFRGTRDGYFISDKEKDLYHPDVDVYWQKSAWADTEFSVKWIENTLKKAVETSDTEFLLLCDNLGCQVKEEFKNAIRSLNGIVYYCLKSKIPIHNNQIFHFSNMGVFPGALILNSLVIF